MGSLGGAKGESINEPEVVKSIGRKLEGEVVESDEEDETAKYVVAVTKHNKIARVRRRDGCWRGRDLALTDYELFPEMPADHLYTDYCRHCWPRGGPSVECLDRLSEGSSAASTSSSSTSES